MGNATSTVVINWGDIGIGIGGIIGLVAVSFLFYKFVWPIIPPGIAGAIYEFMSSLFQYSSTGLFSYGFIEFFITQQTDGLIPNLFAVIGLIINKVINRGFGGVVAAAAAAVAAAPGAAPVVFGDPALAAADAAAAAAPRAAPPPNPFLAVGGKRMKGGAFGAEFCSVPGLGFLADGGYSPGSLVLVTTIMFHYLVTIWSNGGGIQSVLPSITLGVLWAVHAVTVARNCGPGFDAKKILLGIVMGLVFGVCSWATLKYGLKKGGSPGSPAGSRGPLGSGSTGPTTPGVGTCSAPNDQDQFVCEAYRNGELITTTIAE